MKKSEIIDRYGVEEYERRKEQMRRYHAENREKRVKQMRQYHAEHKKEIAEQMRQYYAENKEQARQYYAENKEERTVYQRQYNSTPIGRANYLASGYRQSDKKKGFLNVENQVDNNFILNNIFNSSCIYCGESDWVKLGCDRIDNTKPHTIDNVVCSCWDCNNERKAMPFDEFMRMKRNKKPHDRHGHGVNY